jgi:hypothetical protein
MASDLLWTIFTSPQVTEVVQEQALNNFCELMKMWDLRSSRIDVLMKCCDEVRENRNARKCLIVM